MGTAIESSIIVCSLEPWDDVWRRNQFFVEGLQRQDTTLRVLFVEPAIDVPYELAQRRWPARAGLKQVQGESRVWSFRPRKWLPRVVGGGMVDASLGASVLSVVGRLKLASPLLWVNDLSYACLARQVDWPVVYDVTDDWLLTKAARRSARRLRRSEVALMRRADEVVVVSSSLARSRGLLRDDVHVIGCGVDVEHFRRPQARPADMPWGKVALYVGTLHDERVDVGLCVATAKAIRPGLLVLVGPNCLREDSNERLLRAGCKLLGPRPYAQVPAYYQHADVVVVPHVVTPFTESLDPIKGYECLAVGRPTLSTPVAGMRELGGPVEVCPPREFPERARALLAANLPSRPGEPPTWDDRTEAFAAVLQRAREKARARTSPKLPRR